MLIAGHNMSRRPVGPCSIAAAPLAAADAAAKAFPAWAAIGPGERRAMLMKAAQSLAAKSKAFANAVAAETGGSVLWAGFNVHLASAGVWQQAVLKGSELCPATHGLIVEALHDAGLPAGVVNFVTNAPADAAEVVEAMIAQPDLHVGRAHHRRREHR
ncbi:aldehyde dehydrogenase family protein [Thiomonas sp. X19]|uniref:aldehyde dehydrogenase family protein n=1 Tax=Thiomonas sp. X19 TaxID=1050370 RepID=UPI001E4347D2|nr:aldehyde dehydrogenase family protein [Thiomonas sp. X19]